MKRKKNTENHEPFDAFNKLFEFKGNDTWKLPRTAFVSQKWQIEILQQKKQQLNFVKEKLTDLDQEAWHYHTKKRDPSTQIIKSIRSKYYPELLTQAWCKFFECVSKHDLVPFELIECNTIKSLHLCEAPGGFVTALNHYLKQTCPEIKLQWKASSLNPNYEGNALSKMIPDDRLIINTKQNWLFGSDYSGDIMQYYNYEDLCKESTKNGKMDIVTADGSVNCMDDPGNQELNVERLHYCEVVTALSVLKTGGNFLLKIFTCFEECTICILYLLNCCFNSVSVFKPITSKSGNSETYVINKGFKGHQLLSTLWHSLLLEYKQASGKSLFQLADLNEHFLNQIIACAEFFKEKQIITIEQNLKCFKKNHDYAEKRQYKKNMGLTKRFLELYQINKLSEESKIVQGIKQFPKYCVSTEKKDCSSSFLYYLSKETDLKFSFVSGKALHRVLFTKFFADTDQLNSLLEKRQFNIENENSLFFKLKTHFLSGNFAFIAYSNYLNYTQSYFHKEMLSIFKENNGKNMLLINVPLITNFLIGLLFLFTQEYSVYFFKKGIILLIKSEPEKSEKLEDYLNLIKQKQNSLKPSKEFKIDLLEILDLNDVDSFFIHCINFYNNNII